MSRSCEALCGDRRGRVCRDGCAEHPPSPGMGTTLLRRRTIHGSYHDVIHLMTDDSMITLLHPLDGSFQEDVLLLDRDGLTPREAQVAKLVLSGFRNAEITQKLGISKSTLKAHINRIHQKRRGERLRGGE